MLMYPLGFSFLFFFGPVCVSFSHLIDLESEIPVCPSSVINSCVLFSRDVQMSVAFVGSHAVSCFCGRWALMVHSSLHSRGKLPGPLELQEPPVWAEGVEFISQRYCSQSMLELSLESQQMSLKTESTRESHGLRLHCGLPSNIHDFLIILK